MTKDSYLIPSPYLLPSTGVARRFTWGGARAIAVLIGHLFFPPDLETNPDWQTDVGVVQLNLRRFVVAEFVRRYFDKRFQDYPIPRAWNREHKDSIILESKLWGETWKLIEQLYSRSVFAPDIHPVVTFYNVIEERVLLQPYAYRLSPEEQDKLTATGAARQIQSENKLLQTLGTEGTQSIPFDRTTTPVTWQLLEQSRRLANLNDDFKKQYMAVVECRMALASHLRSDHPKVFATDRKRQEFRGKKPKKSRGFTGNL